MHIGRDLRPVFPEERLLLEIILGQPLKYKDSSVWSSGSGLYIVDGKRVRFSVEKTKQLDIDSIRTQLQTYAGQNTYEAFDVIIERFISANKRRFDFLIAEALHFIRDVADHYSSTERYVSFSGGKDSTVVSSLVMRALGSEDVLHIYGLPFQNSLFMLQLRIRKCWR